MAKYTDTKGREWPVRLTVRTVKSIRDEVTDGEKPFDILDISGGVVLAKLNTDPVLVSDTLWIICRELAKERGVSQDDFLDSLTGDAILDAGAALVEALADFFPKLEGAQVRKAQAYIMKARMGAAKETEKNIDALSGT